MAIICFSPLSYVRIYAMAEYLLIINPNSSKGKGRAKAQTIRNLFLENGKSIDISYTQREGHAFELALEGANSGYSAIIACGGDGTVNEVVNGIMRSGKAVKMGIIPIGRGNDIAWNYGIKGRLEDSVSKIIKGDGCYVDVGIVKGGRYPDGRYFLNGNGYGFEPLVTFLAMDFKKVNGIISYVLAFIRIMLSPPKPYEIVIKTEREERKVSTQQISISIGRRMGSTFILAPDAVVDDGYFDLMYTIHPFTRFSLILAVLRFLRGTHLKDKKDFEGYRTRSVRLSCPLGGVYSHVDGEIVSYGDGFDFDIDIIEKGIYIFS